MTSTCLLATLDPSFPGGSGWVGEWTPGIGDPTLPGWVTVLAYAAATALGYLLRARISAAADSPRAPERRYWGGMALILLFLYVNKQLDLQTAMTEFFRDVAKEQGWYPVRHRFQVAFIATVAMAFPVGAEILFTVGRRLPLSAKVAGLGLLAITAFVLIRAVSFHHVDRLLRARVLHLRLNWIFELGGLAVVMFGEVARWRELGQEPRRT
jgi:hypothetical protein